MESLYDRALTEIGSEGKFQRNFDIVYNVLFPILWAVAYNNIVLALVVIPHTCKIPEKPENMSKYDWTSKYIPTVKSVTGLQKHSNCLIYTNRKKNETKACDFVYDNTWYESTVPSDNDWVCDKEIYVAEIRSYTKVGEILGSLFFGWFGDVYGRKLTYVFSVLLLVIGRFLCVLSSSSFALIAIGCIIASLPSWFAPQSVTIISCEISSPKRRSTVAKLRLLSTSLGLFLTPFFYWGLRNWKSFMIITTVPQLLFLLFSWKLIESPQWLMLNRKSKHALHNLKLIAKANKNTICLDTETEILTTRPEEISKKTDVLGPFALFSGWQIALNTILQLLIWFAVSANYGVSLYSSGEKTDGNPFLDFAWQALAEIPGYFVGAWLADHIGRRYTGMASFTLTTIIWVLYGYREISTAAWMKNEWLSTTLAVINRTSMTVAYYIIDLLNIELYPTCLRQSGMSLGNVVSGGGGAFASYIVVWAHHIDARYSSTILIIITIFCGFVSTFFLPETLNAKLPETLEDARKFGTLGYKRCTTENTENIQLHETFESSLL